MKPFMITTTEFQNGQPRFILKGLSFGQRRFVEGCVKAFREQTIPDANLSVIYWKNSEDFAGMMLPAEDPFIAELEFTAMFEDHMEAA